MVTGRPRAVRILLVSALASGQGKTTVTAALARALVRQGKRVRVFKTGPDFIDPMLLERASGHPVHSLDLWMVGEALCRQQLAQAAEQADAILIEGVMGLYDGTPSSADLARTFGVPVMLAIDASAMAQTAGAIVHGLRDYGPVDVAGVIANRVGSAGHAAMIAEALRGIPLCAHLPRQAHAMPERHLGLVLPNEVADIDTLLDRLADDLVFDPATWEGLPLVRIEPPPALAQVPRLLAGAPVAIACDDAFAFVYPANLDTLHALGAEICHFSPLADEPVPADATAVYLPGGYPELHAAVLSKARRWQASLQAAHASGMPILAECGGMMALAETLVDQAGQEWPMAGLLPGRASMQTRLAGLGSQGLSTPDGELRGHTFHYARFDTPLAPAAHTFKPAVGGRAESQGEAVYRLGSLTASFFHAYFPSCPKAVGALFARGGAQ